MTEGTCIYCKNFGPLTKEHVMPRALGGNFTAYIVCEKCRFSELDQSLAENTVLAMARVGFTPPGAFPVMLGGQTFYYDKANDLFLEMVLANRMTPRSLPQFHFRFEGRRCVARLLHAEGNEDQLSIMRFIDRRVSERTILGMHVKVGPPEVCTTARIVLHRKDDGFVRAASREHADAVLQGVSRYWNDGMRKAIEDGESSFSVREKPKVDIRLSMCPDDEYRAVAKIAFNTLAADVGAAFALRAEFDELRDYIRGIDLRYEPQRVEDEILIDHRFVSQPEAGHQPTLQTNGHIVFIMNHGPKLLALVNLYRDHEYAVLLGKVALDRLVPVCREFSILRDGSELLGISEIYYRMRGRGTSLQ
jgi:hypothetical protein